MLVIDKKFLEGAWWKYGLLLGLAQVTLWMLFGYRFGKDFSAWSALATGYYVYGGFLIFAMLPFVAGRLQFKAAMWFALVGDLLGLAGYYVLGTNRAVISLYYLLPFVAFLQFSFLGLSLGVVIEFGRYVYHKVFEEP
jgi:hypothetical protein